MSQPRPSEQNMFLEALKNWDTLELERLLQTYDLSNVNINLFDSDSGQNALHKSVISGNLQMVKLLVKMGADVRLANRDGWTSLHMAAYGGRSDIMCYLMNSCCRS